MPNVLLDVAVMLYSGAKATIQQLIPRQFFPVV